MPCPIARCQAIPSMASLKFPCSRSPLQLLSSSLSSNFIRTGRVYASSLSTSKTPTATTWVDRLPLKVQPYLYLTRIDKPIGTLLLFYPCSASFPACRPFVRATRRHETYSLVNYHGIIRAQRATVRSPHIHRTLRHWCSDNAWRGMHDQ